MRERPILFSGPMVRAILSGRKTQTRRVVSRGNSTVSGYKTRAMFDGLALGPGAWADGNPSGFGGLGCGQYLHVPERYCGASGDAPVHRVRCDTEPGDRLWVKETFFEEYDPITAKPYDPPRAIYAATHEGGVRKMDGDGGSAWRKDGTAASPWRPSIFMPRWASRLTLEVTEVRVERVQDISDSDARAEGMEGDYIGTLGKIGEVEIILGARGRYAILWDSINGKRPGCGWAENPWVWVIAFRVTGAECVPEEGR